jgi:hypothetical protein
VNKPPIPYVDGVRLDCFYVGECYEVGNSVGALLLAEAWAEPVPLDSLDPIQPFNESDPFASNERTPGEPPNLVRETHPPFVDELDKAADFRFRRKPRRR